MVWQVLDRDEFKGLGRRPAPEASTDQLARDYPRHATSLFNLVKNAEEAMRGLKKAE